MIEKVKRLLSEGDCRKEETAVKYRDDEAFEEIKRRGKRMKQKHEQRVRYVLSASTVSLALVLLVTLSVFTGAGKAGSETLYGSFLMPAEAGSYVLTALIAFAFGVAITLSIKYYRNKEKNESISAKQPERGEED